jgi:uncharacterized hydrophobic protein (TIGR00341 family)
MPLRILEISAPASLSTKIREIATLQNAIDLWFETKNKNSQCTTKILVHLEHQQALLDKLHKALYNENGWRIVVLPVEATIPKQEEQKDGDKNLNTKRKLSKGTLSREELYNDIEKSSTADGNFVLMVFLSVLVCATGLIENNVAVIIGAMVIAPLLGPNLAMSFGAALGDKTLMMKSIRTNVIGLSLTLAISFVVGILMKDTAPGYELLNRTEVGFETVMLSLAAGAAAVLSLTTGISSTMVGVMVAVALMPPAIALGIFLGSMEFGYAYGAALLLFTNIVCISLSAQIIYLIKDIRPRTWYMQQKSKQSVKLNAMFWIAILFALMILIYVRNYL